MISLRRTARIALSFIIGGGYRLLCKMKICRPYIIMQMDGGICSQMFQYLQGQLYAEKGASVGYDLTWFKRCGMDVDKRFVRTFELETMFPGLVVKTFSDSTIWFYKHFLRFTSPNHLLPQVSAKIAPVYLAGYYGIDDEDFARLFQDLFVGKEMALQSPSLSRKYPRQHLCAVHVRRGDLAKGDNPYYGGVSDDYFFRAIYYVENLFPDSLFYFFSDEMDYVRHNLVPHLSVSYELVSGPNKAYEDLLLIAECDTIIASQGNFGKFAAMLNENSLLILNDDKYAKPWLVRKKHSLIL